MSIVKHWMKTRITEILGFEDEVVINFATSELESPSDGPLCPKKLSLVLTGFLEKNTSKFMVELW